MEMRMKEYYILKPTSHNDVNSLMAKVSLTLEKQQLIHYYLMEIYLCYQKKIMKVTNCII